VTAKVSIDDIVDKQPSITDPTIHTNKLKRKADAISQSTAKETEESRVNSEKSLVEEFVFWQPNQSSDSGTDQQTQHEMAAQQLAQLKDSVVSTAPELTSTSVAGSPTTAAVEPAEASEQPVKRFKTSNPPGSSTFAKYAATAVGGVILGGIGAVAALISLPPDYFV